MTSWQSWLGRGVPVAALALTLTYAPGVFPSASATAAPRTAVVAAPGCYGGDDPNDQDFDGDGRLDVPAGAPDADVGPVHDAGAVEVRYGCAARPAQRLTLPHPHRGDRFGAALAGGTYEQDYRLVHVLFVGVPRLDVAGHQDAGGVAEFHGSGTGLELVKLWTQDTKGVPGKVRSGAHFGAALDLEDEDDESFLLRVGEPGLDVGHASSTGGYVTLNWNEDPGSTPAENVETTLASYGVRAQDGDLFGSSFSTLGVGAPGRRVHGHRGAGAVVTFDSFGTGSILTQSTAGIAGSPGTGDHFGASLSGLWIGVPGEKVGGARGAGVVQSWDPYDPAPPSVTISQDTPGVPGSAGSDHHFGAALAFAGDDAQDAGPGVSSGFVGAPGDRSGAGSVTVLRLSSAGGLAGDAVVLPAPGGAGGHFGTSLAESGTAHLLVGAPGVRGGTVYSYARGSRPTDAPSLQTSWAQTVPDPGARFGTSLADQEGYPS